MTTANDTLTAIDPSMRIERPQPDVSQRKVALVAGIALLLIALIAPFAYFGALGALVVPTDAAATFDNIVASQGLFRSAIAALLIVIILDVVVAWALYVLLAPVDRTIALLTGWLRLAFSVAFANALTNLLDAAQLVTDAARSTLPPEQLHEQMASYITSFENGWTGVALAIFGVHLIGLGYLVFRSANFPRFLGVLVIVAGGGYLVDAFGTILVSDYSLSVAGFAFVGEALLIFWLLWRGARGFADADSTSSPS